MELRIFLVIFCTDDENSWVKQVKIYVNELISNQSFSAERNFLYTNVGGKGEFLKMGLFYTLYRKSVSISQ